MTHTAPSRPVGAASATWLAAMLCVATPLAQAAEYPALLDWSGRVTLTLPVSGVLESVAARAGQSIRKGELLASLNPALFKAGVAEARADVPPELPAALLDPRPVIAVGALLWAAAAVAAFSIPALQSWRPVAVAGLGVGLVGLSIFLGQRSAARRGARGAQTGLKQA